MKTMSTDGFQVLVLRSMKLRSKVLLMSSPNVQMLNTSHILEHNISGDVLCMLDAEDLKAIGISTVGQRLAILKAVYQAKLAHHVPVEADHYIPPCAHFCDGYYFKN